MSALALLDCLGGVGGWGRVGFGDPGEHDLRGHSGSYRGSRSEDRGMGHRHAGRESNFLVPLLVVLTPVKIPIDFISEKHTD